ncbi:MAG: hypothetical protein NTW87_19105 [Planctomycetota bacterium]|nr:hypothetical protein [Planctomycetota bacterium]
MRKRAKRLAGPDMLPEYDFKHGVRGKYYGRIAKNPRVFLVPDKPRKTESQSAPKPLERAMRGKV